MTRVREPIALRLDESGRPRRLVWGGHRYRVSDQPTPLADYIDERITHPVVSPPFGWRFQGTDEEKNTRVFDVLFDRERVEWILVGTYA
jgi:hypothetical protein